MELRLAGVSTVRRDESLAMLAEGDLELIHVLNNTMNEPLKQSEAAKPLKQSEAAKPLKQSEAAAPLHHNQAAEPLNHNMCL